MLQWTSLNWNALIVWIERSWLLHMKKLCEKILKYLLVCTLEIPFSWWLVCFFLCQLQRSLLTVSISFCLHDYLCFTFRYLDLLVLLEIQWVLQEMLELVSRIFYQFLAKESCRYVILISYSHKCHILTYNWFFQSPSGLFTGIAQGSKSLLSNTVYAISSATTQFSKAAHKV